MRFFQAGLSPCPLIIGKIPCREFFVFLTGSHTPSLDPQHSGNSLFQNFAGLHQPLLHCFLKRLYDALIFLAFFSLCSKLFWLKIIFFKMWGGSCRLFPIGSADMFRICCFCFSSSLGAGLPPFCTKLPISRSYIIQGQDLALQSTLCSVPNYLWIANGSYRSSRAYTECAGYILQNLLKLSSVGWWLKASGHLCAVFPPISPLTEISPAILPSLFAAPNFPCLPDDSHSHRNML